MNSHKQVEAIYLDIKKAFDSVDVELLCHKLQVMGLNQQILNWLNDYLTDRQQLVRINSSNVSHPIQVTSGVGQGYPIGATLFILFIADLPQCTKSASISLFADDTKLFMTISTASKNVLNFKWTYML